MLRKLWKNESGASAVEFAIIAFPFLFLVIGTIDIGYKSLKQSSLDSLSFDFAMRLAREDDAGLSQEEVRTDMICQDVPVFLECDQIVFGALAIRPNWRLDGRLNEVFADSWDTGCAGQTVVVEMLYPVTHIITPFAVADIIEYNGQDHYRARGMIRREPLIVGNTGGGGLC